MVNNPVLLLEPVHDLVDAIVPRRMRLARKKLHFKLHMIAAEMILRSKKTKAR